MKQLLTSYSGMDIIVFAIILALGIKNLVLFYDWAKGRTKQAIEKDEKPNKIEEAVFRHEQQMTEIKKQLDVVQKNIQLLMQSDKDDIKHSITKDHHYFCYKLKCIDDYSLDCIERKYQHYRDQGGNSFVRQLMDDLRALPRKLIEENPSIIKQQS